MNSEKQYISRDEALRLVDDAINNAETTKEKDDLQQIRDGILKSKIKEFRGHIISKHI